MQKLHIYIRIQINYKEFRLRLEISTLTYSAVSQTKQLSLKRKEMMVLDLLHKRETTRPLDTSKMRDIFNNPTSSLIVSQTFHNSAMETAFSVPKLWSLRSAHRRHTTTQHAAVIHPLIIQKMGGAMHRANSFFLGDPHSKTLEFEDISSQSIRVSGARIMVRAHRWLRGIETYTFPW